ncbi:AarF/ABC1/UbiB kinase family protein [Archangium minus]|uniref:AarF/ABC1/UbiB kinase family protein n=1 Tax=Archangium minus TaxID=83450 RepID=A0ABY9WRQ7_9BACT|nr:AarF/ABC1/UbiB kinase family protein [Archangium minus]
MSDDPSIPSGRLKRLTRIAGMATQVGASLATDRVKRLLGRESDGHAVMAQRVLETLGSLKGAALKAGQALTLFSSQLPPEARVIIGKLFSQAPRLPFAEIATVIQEELGAPPSEIFAEFSEEPFAAASLGQVHEARLRTGERVAVKVQYPGIAAALEDDLRNLESLLKSVGMGGLLLDAHEYAEEIRRELSGELDYRRELAQLEHYRGLLAPWPDLVVPKAWPELSTGRVLTLERLEGPTLNELAHDVDSLPEEVRFRRGEQLLRAVCGPWMLHRTIHADTHPGNYLALPDGRLGVLDFGSVKTGSEPFWRCTLVCARALMEGSSLDWVTIHEQGGFHIGISKDKAQKLLEEISRIAVTPLQEPYDYATDTIIEKLSELKLRYPLDLIRIRPPAESLMVGRAMAGLLQNLRALKVRGDFRPFFRNTLNTALAGPR